MILRALALIFGVSGAAALSQFPEFAQQYLQRLAGKVDQLELRVAQIDGAAVSFGMTRAEYLEVLGSSITGAVAAEGAASDIALQARLATNIDAFRDAGAYQRLWAMWGVADLNVARGTLADYRPALPLTQEGAGFAALGFALGWGLWQTMRWPFRRRRAEPLFRKPQATAVEEDDDAPFIEYEGNIGRAMNKPLPELSLAAHDGSVVDLAMLKAPIAIFTYPLMGRPGVPYPEGWQEVEEADNAAALACSFRDCYDMVRQAGIQEVFGISPQSVDDQREAAHRLALPYTLLSDPGMELSFALDLPRFVLNHERYMAPAVLVTQGGRILAALHPVRDAATAAPRLLRKLAQARLDYQEAKSA